VACFLSAGYTFVWTNVEAAAATDEAVADLRRQWNIPANRPSPITPSPVAVSPPASTATPATPGPAAPVPSSAGTTPAVPSPPATGSAGTKLTTAVPVPGRPFALMTIPRLGGEWVRPVIEGSGGGPGGISADDLRRGVAHYPSTAAPGETGNFAVAGHRTTYGQPFRHLERVRAGDAVVVETADERLAYVVRRSTIVTPTNAGPLWAVPFRPDTNATEATLTLTTCHPVWSDAKRLIVVAVLAERSPRLR